MRQLCLDAEQTKVSGTKNESGTSSGDENVTVENTYTADGNVATLTAVNGETGDQTTQYVYGTTDESGVIRSDLLIGEIYPDAADSEDQVSYRYNIQGDVTEMQDQNDSVHAYSFDLLGMIKGVRNQKRG